jgi:hypothetical protein
MVLDRNGLRDRIRRWYQLEKILLFAYLGITSLLIINFVIVVGYIVGFLLPWDEMLRSFVLQSSFAGLIDPIMLGLYAAAFICLLAALLLGLWIGCQQRSASRRMGAENAVSTNQEPQFHYLWGCTTWGVTFLFLFSFVVLFTGNTLTLFSPYSTSGTTSLVSVGLVSSRSAWAVGTFYYYAGGVRGVIWHYDGQTWKNVADPSRESLEGVSMLPSGEGWAVGDDGVILHERGNLWQSVPSPTTDTLQSVAMRAADEGWAVGGVYQTPILLGPNSHLLTRVNRPGWLATGGSIVPDYRITCTILHYVSGKWGQVSCPVRYPLLRVKVLPDGEAWAVGMGGEIVHEVGGIWSAVPSPSFSGGTIYHWQEGTWKPVASPTQHLLDAVVMLSAVDGWAVGDSSTILHYQQGTWSIYPSLTSPDEALFGLAFLPDGQEGWIVGSDGIILHFHAGVWSRYNG